MAVQVPRLKRGLFGYRPKIVRSILTGREIMFARVWQRLQQTEGERDRVRAQLEASRAEVEVQQGQVRLAEDEGRRQAERAEAALAEIAELRSLNESLRARIHLLDAQAAEAASARGGATSPEDLWTSLEQAERSLTDVIERARRENEERLEAIEAARRELRAETERLAAWRTEAESILGNVRGALAELAGVAARLPGVGSLIPTETVHIPEATSDSNGQVPSEDLAAIQELYGSR
jgi:chromosome segregation ATPase